MTMSSTTKTTTKPKFDPPRLRKTDGTRKLPGMQEGRWHTEAEWRNHLGPEWN